MARVRACARGTTNNGSLSLAIHLQRKPKDTLDVYGGYGDPSYVSRTGHGKKVGRDGRYLRRRAYDRCWNPRQGLPTATAARDHDFFGIAERHAGVVASPLTDSPHATGRGAGLHGPHAYSHLAAGGSRPPPGTPGGAAVDGASAGAGGAPSPPRATGITGSSNRFASAANPNAGNALTDRPITRIMHPPGGGSSIVLG